MCIMYLGKHLKFNASFKSPPDQFKPVQQVTMCPQAGNTRQTIKTTISNNLGKQGHPQDTFDEEG